MKTGFHIPPALLGLAVSCFLAHCAFANDSLEYNRDILPILAENCFACHGADSSAREADLRLDLREAAIELSAIVPDHPEESELVARVMTDDPDLLMPPPASKKQLTDEQIEILERWIAAGAEYQQHWSFIASTKPEPPTVPNEAWGKNAIDRFVLAQLKAHGLSPAEEADPRTLFRRLHLDITGLPPNPCDLDAFVSDYEMRSERALSDWIDQLMQSPSWGEHRARYWLDAARYGDTHGLHFDNYREMWPYRDWVIRAFNANQPFDEFIVEQIAGDLLDEPTDDQLIATGFQRCNMTTNEGGTIDEENLANYAVDRVQTFGWVFLGLTTNCSQCHDHKFDPFTMKDFYSLAAYFRNTKQGPKDGNVKDGRGPALVVPSTEDRTRWNALPAEIDSAKAARDQHKLLAREESRQWAASITQESLLRAVPTENLIVHMPLDEGQGSICSAELPKENAKLRVQAAGELQWRDTGAGRHAPVIHSGSTFELGELGDFERDQAFSYGAWVRPADSTMSGSILARMDEQAKHRGWDLWQNGNTYSVHLVDSWPENSIKVSTKSQVVLPGQWQHVFATYDGSGKPDGIHFYVDGKEQAVQVDMNTLQADASLHTQTPLRIGQRSQGAVLEGAAIQDVRIYGRALSAAEVLSITDNRTLQLIAFTQADQRTGEQEEAIFAYYLATQDQEYARLDATVTALESELESIRERSPVTHIQQEKMDSLPMAHILIRGEYDRKGEEVGAATPIALHPFPKDAPNNRLGLAQWIVAPANPLTARVTVNRFWQEVFGQGIVTTTEDFGVMGAPPSHPELLDWLAVDFQESHWDVRRFFKLMLMSATYRQAATVTPKKNQLDRDNRLLSRGPRFRMDAEMVRDYALAVSGLLSNKMYGPSVKPYQPEGIWDMVGLPEGNTRNYVPSQGEDLYRRTLYTFWKRMAPPPDLEAFNAPSREVCTVRRERTNTPLQALVTLNDPQYVEAARHLATLALEEAYPRDSQTLDHIAQRVVGRNLLAKEQDVLMADKEVFLAYYQSHPADAAALISVGESKPNQSLDPCGLATWTMVCNQVMNLDEVLNK